MESPLVPVDIPETLAYSLPILLLVTAGHSKSLSAILTRSSSQPTLVVWGERDEWLDVEDGQWLHEKLPNSEFQIIPDAGHFAPEDKPKAVAASIDEFFKQDHSQR